MNINKKLERYIQELGFVKNIGSSQSEGRAYHGLPFKDIAIKTHRANLSNRVRLITDHYNPKDKTGIDLGCNIGGFVFSMQLLGAKMTGYDYDNASIDLAEAVEGRKKTGAKFVCAPINIDILSDRIDFCLWLSQFMWLVRSNGERDALEFMYNLSLLINDVMFFETSMADSIAGDEMVKMGITNPESVRNLLITNTCFMNIKNLGAFQDGWSRRPVFLCSNPKVLWRGATSEIQRISPSLVKKTYFNKYFEGFPLLKCKESEVNYLNRLDSPHFPKAHEHQSPIEIVMDYCGIPLTKENMPSNYQQQIGEILSELNRANIVHRDIRPDNLLLKDGVIKLIDFGWSSDKGHEMENFPKGLGWDFRPGFPEPATKFDDEYSLKKSINAIVAKDI